MDRVNCLVTAGPTYEPLDQVRRLTNFSTGRLGVELANCLVAHGHQVPLLIGEAATWAGPRRAQQTEVFTTTADLQERLAAHAAHAVDAVFHAAAVSDFRMVKLWVRAPTGELTEVRAGKISTQHPSLLMELEPTPKILGQLRGWFPAAQLVGWKYEVEGDRASVLAKAQEQIRNNRTDACLANGPAYGSGYGLVEPEGRLSHLEDREALGTALCRWLAAR
jgi:phosphopantothenate---cysteine ligase (CTP)